MKKLTKKYFKDRKEASEIELALTLAIPDGAHYSALVMALSNMLNRVAAGWVNEICGDQWHGEEPEAQQ